MSLNRLAVSVKKQLDTITDGDKSLKKIPDNIDDFSSIIKVRSGDIYVPFILYDHQKELLDVIESHRYTLAVKSRQMGATQVILMYFLYKAISNAAYSALIFSKTQEDTSLLAYRCREMIKSLDGYVITENDNLKTIRLVNGGVLYFRNSKIDGARGIDSVTDILYDEAAFVPDIDKIYAATSPCQRMTGESARTIIISTPNGAAGWYFDKANSNNPQDVDLIEICNQVRKGQLPPIYSWDATNNWGKILFHWKSHPIYGKEDNYLERLSIEEDMPMEQINQEYDLSFEDSNEKIFSVSLVRSSCIGEFDKNYIPDCHYYLSLDPQFSGNDYAVVTVIKHDLHEDKFYLVDMYRKRQQTKEYHVGHIFDLIDKYNPESFTVETNGGGKIYFEEISDYAMTIDVQEVYTTEQRKHSMINRLLLFLERKKLILPNDKTIKNELFSFQRNGNKLEPIAGRNDDIVMALALNASSLPLKKTSQVSYLNQSKVI